MSSSKDRGRQRREKVEQMRAQEQRADRRRSFLIVGSAVVVAVAIVAAAAIAVVNSQREQQSIEQAAKRPIEGVQKFDNLSRNHVNGQVTYEQTPPVGGDHEPTWTNCGIYTSTPDVEKSVHSLEHGAVWITYRPGLAQSEIDTLTKLVKGKPYAMLSPYEGMKGPITASAWGYQLTVDKAQDPRLATFLQKYLQGPQTPEPGAPCSGGAGGM